MSWRIVGIRGLTSSRAALALMIDCPNLSPNPLNASAAALSVRLTLTGSTFCAIEVIVWNKVLISVVTDLASITLCDVISGLPHRGRFGSGQPFGVVSDTYFSPKTVVATILASTSVGIRLRYLG